MKHCIATFLLLSLASMASAHTSFTTLFIDRKNQGDGTCVRTPSDGETATNPIHPITSEDIVCGRDGNQAVSFICPANQGSLLTFEWRQWPDAQQPGSIDPGHLGPCAVYIKKVDDMFTESAAGGGWFKIWEDGYNPVTQKWCVDRLVENNGLLSVNLPRGLPSGYYIVRPEIVALHWAVHRDDPQYFVGCAQIFVNSDVQGPLNVPEEHLTSIPGYVDLSTPGLKYDIYQNNLPPYPIPGPKVYIPKVDKEKAAETPAPEPMIQTAGVIPEDCVLKSANWCAKAVSPYSTEDGCWTGVTGCFAQNDECRPSAQTIGQANCDQWSVYCEKLNQLCEDGEFVGPMAFTKKEIEAPAPGEIPAMWNDVFEQKG
ncbi:endoglucanase B [Trichoderma harzianum]|uniref:lytic cellulose monooxygenase (C4-dehydrogenating) n=1 Tax=Trichoderma harzianum TaxID=5544 RepID=A0A0F9ZXF7_TRIHA|nr:endoglucanase B [Trichoderma harzianum]